MKKFHLFAAILLSQSLFAQNWINLPGTSNYPIYRFYNDTIANRLLAVGSFDSAGVVLAQGIAAWDGNSWSSLGIPTFSSPPSISAVVRYNSDLYLGGGFPNWNASQPYLARWNGSTLDSIGRFVVGGASGLLTYHNDLIVYDNFSSDTVNGVPFNGIVRWDGTNWSDLGHGALYGSVFSMVVYRDTLYASCFSSIDHLMYVFRYVNNAWQTVGSNFSAVVDKLCVYNNELYAGGGHYNSNAPNALQKLDTLTDTWNTVGGGVSSATIAPYSSVLGMCVHNGALYVGGAFDHAGGVPAVEIAKWDGVQWCGLGVDYNSGGVNICTSYNGDLYLGTGIIFDNDTTECFVKWNGVTDTCGFISTGIEVQPTEQPTVNFYPNPVKENGTFQFTGITGDAIIRLYDDLGREVWSEKVISSQTILTVSGYASGIYFYRLEEQGKNPITGKLIVQ